MRRNLITAAAVLLVAAVAPAPASAAVGHAGVCATAFPGAKVVTDGSARTLNRQASVQAVLCGGIDSRASLSATATCTLLASAVGSRFTSTAQYLDGPCSAPRLARGAGARTRKGSAACSMVGDLARRPPGALLEAYALDPDVHACLSAGKGDWAVSAAQRRVAQRVMRDGACLRSLAGGDWLTVTCDAQDRGFAAATAVRATLSQFAGLWVGHTRTLEITSSGRATEVINDGCCTRVARLTLALSRPSGTMTAPTVSVRVLSVRIFEPADFRVVPRAGATGTLRIRNGVVTDSVTAAIYCDAFASMRGTCGA